MIKHTWIRGLIGVLAPVILAATLRADDARGARIACQYIGRVSLGAPGPNGAAPGIVYGYFTHIDGAGSGTPLFDGGTVGETKAFLTFRANITVTAGPANGELSPGSFALTTFLVDPGSFQIYFTAKPNHQWGNPDSFSDGQVVATLLRVGDLFSISPYFALNAASASLAASSPFVLGGRRFDLRDVFPHGVTNVTTGPPIPLPGPGLTFAFAGYSLKIGE